MTFSTPFNNVSDNAIVKADQHLKMFSPEDLFTGRYFYSHGIQSFPLGMLFYRHQRSRLQHPDADTCQHRFAVVYLGAAPNLIVEFARGYNRFLEQFLPQDMGLNPTHHSA